VELDEDSGMAIVMGLDQHRAQVTAEWIDTETGEVSRARIAPAHREPVRRFVGRFRGRELEVALEATTGWRFVVQELRATICSICARVRLRHTLSDQRGEWQQRIQAVLYHHGCPRRRDRRDLMTREGRRWLAEQALPATAREQVTVALLMIDALDVQLADRS
jgi:hypothetical protein